MTKGNPFTETELRKFIKLLGRLEKGQWSAAELNRAALALGAGIREHFSDSWFREQVYATGDRPSPELLKMIREARIRLSQDLSYKQHVFPRNVLPLGRNIFISHSLPITAPKPPRSAEYFLNLILDPLNYDKIGDLEERFQTEMVPKFGVRQANIWYWKQVVFSAGSFLWPRLVKLASISGLTKFAHDVYRKFIA